MAGGYSGTAYLASAELYDIAGGDWSATGSMSTACEWQTATLLPNGDVLVAGGYNDTTYLSGCEIYDTSGGTWSGTGALGTGRNYHAATLLGDGRVMVSGGFTGAPSSAAWRSSMAQSGRGERQER